MFCLCSWLVQRRRRGRLRAVRCGHVRPNRGDFIVLPGRRRLASDSAELLDERRGTSLETSLRRARYVGFTGTSEQTPCSAGKYSGSGASSCLECGVGTFSTEGSSSCTSCDAGYSSAVAGASACSPCDPGTYKGAGEGACQECELATYAEAAGSSSCSRADAGSYVAPCGSIDARRGTTLNGTPPRRRTTLNGTLPRQVRGLDRRLGADAVRGRQVLGLGRECLHGLLDWLLRKHTRQFYLLARRGRILRRRPGRVGGNRVPRRLLLEHGCHRLY